MSNLRQEICKELKIIRQNKELLQKEICWDMDISRSTFTHIENGDKNFSIDSLEQWANSLGYEIKFTVNKTLKP